MKGEKIDKTVKDVVRLHKKKEELLFRNKQHMGMMMELMILDSIQNLRTPVLDHIMCIVSTLGNAGVIWILLAVLLFMIPKTRKAGMFMIGALLVDVILCNGLLKNLVARTRPFDVNTAIELIVKKPKDFSFPSGHTAASFASITALFLAGEKKLAWPALILGTVMAFSRMYLYVHYPTDILGGIAVGILSGYLGKYCIEIKHLKFHA